MHVVATAGHVDHGKSTLVRALTGMEPDRWAEERRRGMTIDLGFAWTALPSGERIAFVDVPGHERFVTNMLAGVGTVPACMIVVAADEGWMPQSAEHLAALDALGVRDGVLVITRCDRADPGPALRQAREEIAATSLGTVEAVTASGLTGEGMDRLAAALDRLVAGLPVPDPAAPLRLWVDRAFTVKGSGTVVTGTLAAGTVRTGDALVLAPAGRRVRARAVESLRARADAVPGVARVALNLRGVDRVAVSRGMALLTPARWTVTGLIDVRLHAPATATSWPREATLHIGSAGVRVRIRGLGSDTARLTLARPLPLHVGDRALVRDPGSRRIAGLTVLDVRPPALRRRGAAATRARELAAWPDTPGADTVLARHGVLRGADLVAMGLDPGAEPVAGDWLVDPGYRERARDRLVAAVRRHAADHPLEAGLPVEAARRQLGLPDRRLVEVLAQRRLRVANGRVGEATEPGGLPASVAGAVRQLRADLAATPFRAPEAARLTELGLTGKALAAAVRAGILLRLADGIVLAPAADVAAVEILARLPQPFTAAEARKALGTTRRVAIPLLEHLDRLGRTRRVDHARRVVD